MLESAVFVMNAWGHVVDFVVEPFPSADPLAALQAAESGEMQETRLTVPLVSTGIYSGPINLIVEILSARPETISPDWEDIHELSLRLPEGRAYFNTPMDWAMKDVGAIIGDQNGDYRVRLHATGRDTAFDLVVESSVERHFLQFWKESPSPLSVLSSESEHGKSLPRFIKMWQGPGAATAYAGP